MKHLLPTRRKIWRLKVPCAIKHFLWKAYLDILPTRVNLATRKIIKIADCPICNQTLKTLIHSLWDWPIAHDVWGERESPLQK